MTTSDGAAKALDLQLRLVRRWSVSRPPKGWLRAIRDVLGLTTKQLGRRLGVSQPRIVALEKGEIEETVTLTSLRRAAEALNCTLVYALLPREPLADTLRNQAEAKADQQLKRIDHTMPLEKQTLTKADQARQRARMVEDLLRGNPRRLWDEPA